MVGSGERESLTTTDSLLILAISLARNKRVPYAGLTVNETLEMDQLCLTPLHEFQVKALAPSASTTSQDAFYHLIGRRGFRRTDLRPKSSMLSRSSHAPVPSPKTRASLRPFVTFQQSLGIFSSVSHRE